VPPCVVIDGSSSSFSFALDALEVVGQLACEDWLPSNRDSKVRPVCCCVGGWVEGVLGTLQGG
jgi:hypothetical protein